MSLLSFSIIYLLLLPPTPHSRLKLLSILYTEPWELGESRWHSGSLHNSGAGIKIKHKDDHGNGRLSRDLCHFRCGKELWIWAGFVSKLVQLKRCAGVKLSCCRPGPKEEQQGCCGKNNEKCHKSRTARQQILILLLFLLPAVILVALLVLLLFSRARTSPSWLQIEL